MVGDWNVHNPGWDPLCEQADGRGKRMEEWMIEKRWELGKRENRPTWERTRKGRAEESQIDFFISKGLMEWDRGKRYKLLLDHCAITAEIDWHRVGEGVREERLRIDWDKLRVEVAGAEEDHEKGDNGWYLRLEGITAYEKLKSLRDRHLKALVIMGRSKRWWDKELTKQLKTTRKARREKLGDGMI